MNSYAVMLYPAANRVYAESSIHLLAAELRVFDETVLGGTVEDLRETLICGVPYVTFNAPSLGEREIDLLSNISTLYALFGVEGDLFRPIAIHGLDLFDSDLLTIQKYSGKTNELFTKLLLNITALATDSPGDLTERRLRVLDPMCGRGTTLNHAMMYGFDASGVDVDSKDFDEYGRFIKTWLRNKRIKHKADVVPIRRERRLLGRRLDVSVGMSKESYKAGDALKLTYVNADTLRADEFFRSGSFDIVVTDAPYGIQHGSRRETEILTRNPADLLAAAVPGWSRLLRPGGALGISWNTNVLPREDLAEVVSDSGLSVRTSEPYLGFSHRVDQAIMRDIIVATKPPSGE